MRKYEILMLLKPNLKADVKSKIIEKSEKLISGEIVKKEEWGSKKLAYPIKKQIEAEYILYYVKTNGENVLEYRRMVNISKEILRTLILVHEKDFPFNRRTTKDMIIKERKVIRTNDDSEAKDRDRKINDVNQKDERNQEVNKEVNEQVDKKNNEEVDLTSLKLADLKEIAKKKGLKGYSSLKKVELIELIQNG